MAGPDNWLTLIQCNYFYILLHRSQIGHCNSQESYKNQQNLLKAMDQARKLVNSTPTPGTSRRSSLIPLPETTASSIMELLKDITKQSGECTSSDSSISKVPLKEGMTVNLNFVCQMYLLTDSLYNSHMLLFPIACFDLLLRLSSGGNPYTLYHSCYCLQHVKI
jgi:hypothetical protein